MPELLRLAGQSINALGIITAWDLAAHDCLDGLPKSVQVQHRMGGHGFDITEERFLCCFFDDKKLGSMAWSEYSSSK